MSKDPLHVKTPNERDRRCRACSDLQTDRKTPQGWRCAALVALGLKEIGE